MHFDLMLDEENMVSANFTLDLVRSFYRATQNIGLKFLVRATEGTSLYGSLH